MKILAWPVPLLCPAQGQLHSGAVLVAGAIGTACSKRRQTETETEISLTHAVCIILFGLIGPN